MNCQESPGSSTRKLGSSPSTPPYYWCSNHLPRLAEATAGPEDVVLVLVAAPVGVGSGTSASAVFERRWWRHRLAQRKEGRLSERCCLILPANGSARSLCSLHKRPSLLRQKLLSHISSHPRLNPTGTDNPSLHRTWQKRGAPHRSSARICSPGASSPRFPGSSPASGHG